MSRFAVLACALLCGHAFGEGQPAPPVLPIEQFTRYDEFGTVKISPDGKFMALTAGERGRTALMFMDLEQKKIAGGIRTSDPYEIDDFHWASPTRVIYMIAERFPGRAFTSRTGEIFGIDRDGRADAG